MGMTPNTYKLLFPYAPTHSAWFTKVKVKLFTEVTLYTKSSEACLLKLNSVSNLQSNVVSVEQLQEYPLYFFENVTWDLKILT